MSIETFKLTEDHIKLIRQIYIVNNNGIPSIEEKRLFGNTDLYEDIDLILNGKTKEVKHDSEWDDGYSDEQIAEWDTLLQELVTALDIVLFTGSFEPGNFVKRTYERNWVRKLS
jgi:hypothetical protein